MKTTGSNSGRQLQLIIFILISVATITGPFLSFNSRYHGTQIIQHPVEVAKDSIIKDIQYAIVFDGGSTGTRIHIFSFIINENVKQGKIQLDKEYFFYMSPGLSSYYYNATEAAISLDPLIKKALYIVPKLWTNQTPIILKATAGLRLLSDEIAADILQSVEERFKLLPFKVESNAVSILEEQDEGLFAWYTTNYLLGRLHQINESTVTLDLGGGSTQITFSTYNLNTLIKSSKYIVQKNIEGEQEFIYTHSYLGNGLMSARKSILLQNFTKTFNNTDICRYSNEFTIKSACFKILSNRTYTWIHDQNIFHITYDHQNSPENAWEICLRDVQKFIDISNIDKPEELNNRQIFAIGYFYDRMKNIKVIRNESGRVKVSDFFLYSENICNGIIKMKRQSPFLCLDLTYISAYLHYGLGISLNNYIMLLKKINGIEISWALGAAIHMFQN